MEVESKKQRLLFLDNIKLLFAILVIFQHTRVTYQGMGWWYYIEPDQSLVVLDLLSEIVFQTLASIGGLLQASLMGLFFLMGGFLTPKSYDRKGALLFWKERLLRLGIPLLLYILIINPLMYYILAVLDIHPWNTYSSLQGTLLDYYSAQLNSIGQFLDFLTSTGPMWFLWVLLLFTALYTLWRQIIKLDSVQQYIPKELSIPSNFSLLLFALVLGFGTFLVRIVSPIDQFPLGIPVASLIQYLMMFCVGIIAVKNDWFQKMSKDHIKIWSSIIVAVYVSFFLYFLIFLGLDADTTVFLGGSPPTLHALLFALADNIISMGMIFVLIPLFYLKFNTQGPQIKKLSASAFHMYLIHAPILVAVSLVFASIPLMAIIKLLIVFPITIILCYLASYYILQRIL